MDSRFTVANMSHPSRGLRRLMRFHVIKVDLQEVLDYSFQELGIASADNCGAESVSLGDPSRQMWKSRRLRLLSNKSCLDSFRCVLVFDALPHRRDALKSFLDSVASVKSKEKI